MKTEMLHDAENVVCDDKWNVEDNLEDILEDTIEDNLASQSRERPRIHIQPVVENPDIRTILFSEDHPGILNKQANKVKCRDQDQENLSVRSGLSNLITWKGSHVSSEESKD